MPKKFWFITCTSRGFDHVWAEVTLVSGYKVAALALDAASLEAPVTQYGVRISPYRWTCPATRRFGKKGSLPIDISLASMSCYTSVQHIGAC